MPPADSIFSFAASRVRVGSVPVRTKVRPSRVVPRTRFSAVKLRPAVRSRSMRARFFSLPKNSRMASATLGPTSLMRVSSSSVGGDEGVHAAELFGEGLRGALADVANAEAEQDAVERRSLRALDLGEEGVGGFFADAF